MINPDYVFHSAELLTALGVAWKVVKAANRVESVLRDFPPHRHINGSLVYPDGYEPSAVEHLKA